MNTITKSIATFIAAALVLNAMAPALAHAVTQLYGDQVNANALVRDAYIAVIYYDHNDRERMARGWIDAIGETSFTIRSGGLKDKTTIAYAKVLSIVMSEESSVPATQMNEVNRVIGERKRRALAAEHKAKTGVIHLQGDQVNADALVQNAYAVVTYYEDNKQKREQGRIKAIDDTSFTIQNSLLGKTTIAYAKVLSVVIGKDVVMVVKQMNAMVRESQKIETETKAMQRFMTHNAKVRFKAPSLSKERIVGEVVKITQDTLLIREGLTFLQVPMSSISNFEVSLGWQRNTGKGVKIGLVVGSAVSISLFLYAAHLSEKNKNVHNNIDALGPGLAGVYAGPCIFIFSTLIGAATKSEKWVEVSPQRLNLSIAPTPEKGLRAALTVNF